MHATATIEPFGETVEVAPGESVLAAILRKGKLVRYGCKHGGCGTCRARLVEGACRVDARTSFALSDADRADDVVLLCSTHLDQGDATFDLRGLQDLTEDEFHAGQSVDEYDALVEDVIVRTHDIRTLRLRLQSPPRMRFSAGQYVEVEVPGAQREWRCYSMSSPPRDSSCVDLTVKLMAGGRFSSQIGETIGPGTPLRLRGPLGQFAVRLSHRPMIMMAGGVGMGPIRAMVHDLIDREITRPVTLFHGARARRDLLFVDELSALEAEHDWLELVVVLSEPEDHDHWTGETGLVTDAVARRIPSFRGYEAYLCGPPGMIDAAIALLTQGGCKQRHVSFDRFVPSG